MYISTVMVVCVASLKVTSRLTLPLSDGCRSRVLSQFGVKSIAKCKKLLKKLQNKWQSKFLVLYTFLKQYSIKNKKTLKYLPNIAKNLCLRNSDFEIPALSFISEKPIDLNMSS